MRRGLYLHPGFNKQALPWVPRADHRHESAMRLATNVQPPVVRAHPLARLDTRATVDLPTLQNHPNGLKTLSVLLGYPQIEPRLGILRHPPFGVEVSPHIIETLTSPYE